VPPAFASADAASAYDPDTGLFDISYAAAWQLGRMLALGSKSFSVALHNWRRGMVRAHVQAQLGRGVTQLAQQTAFALPHLGPLGRFLTLSMAAAGPAGAWPGHVRALAEPQPDVPDTIANWLGALGLLAGVPFHYLVPHEAMLPQESIRFFTVDPNWTSALIDGTCSLGRSGRGEVERDAALRERLLKAAGAAALRQRASALGQDPPQVAPAQLPRLTGFLLRSAAVGLWPNLQIAGYPAADEDGPSLPLLRFERLADADLAIGLFAGAELVCLDLHEPAEGLHFGLDMAAAGDVISLRAATADQGPIGTVRHDRDNKPIQQVVPMRDKGVMKAGQLAKDLGTKDAPMPSSEFGMQMLQGAARVRYLARSS
jgi:hypothetical protein